MAAQWLKKPIYSGVFNARRMDSRRPPRRASGYTAERAAGNPQGLLLLSYTLGK
jgi:hypothetical protein